MTFAYLASRENSIFELIIYRNSCLITINIYIFCFPIIRNRYSTIPTHSRILAAKSIFINRNSCNTLSLNFLDLRSYHWIYSFFLLNLFALDVFPIVWMYFSDMIFELIREICEDLRRQFVMFTSNSEIVHICSFLIPNNFTLPKSKVIISRFI